MLEDTSQSSPSYIIAIHDIQKGYDALMPISKNPKDPSTRSSPILGPFAWIIARDVHRNLQLVSMIGIAAFAMTAVIPNWTLWGLGGCCLLLRWLFRAFLRHLANDHAHMSQWSTTPRLTPRS